MACMTSFATLTRIGDEPNGVEPPSHDELAHRRDPHFVKLVPDLMNLLLNLRSVIIRLAHRALTRFKAKRSAQKVVICAGMNLKASD